MFKKKILLIIGIILIITSLVIAVILNSTNKYEYTKEEKQEIKKDVTENINSLTSNDLNIDEVKEILDDDSALNVYITVGDESYLRQKPTDEVIKKYNLDNYVKEQDYYISKVEELYKNNLVYNIVSESINGNELCENIEITTWYYALYLNDYIDILNSIDDVETNDTTKDYVEYYKNGIKALKVLDKHLDYYDNKDKEKEELQVCYRNGKLVDSSQMLTLTIALQGELYSNMDFSNEDNVASRNERIKNYLSEVEK